MTIIRPRLDRFARIGGLVAFGVAFALLPDAAEAIRQPGIPESFEFAQRIRNISEAAGFAAPLGFILLYALGTVVVFPSLILTLTGGYLFGVVGGTLVNLAASALGATACLVIARRIDIRRLPFIGSQLHLLEDFVRQRDIGLKTVVVLRLLPLVPFSVVNYGMGLTRIPALVFAAGSFFGLFPKVLLGTYIGATGRELEVPYWLERCGIIILALLVLVACSRAALDVLRSPQEDTE